MNWKINANIIRFTSFSLVEKKTRQTSNDIITMTTMGLPTSNENRIWNKRKKMNIIWFMIILPKKKLITKARTCNADESVPQFQCWVFAFANQRVVFFFVFFCLFGVCIRISWLTRFNRCAKFFCFLHKMYRCTHSISLK